MTSHHEPDTFYMQADLNTATYDNTPDKEGQAGDVAFLVAQARAVAQDVGGPVLELAAGTGRVAWPLAEAGFDVVGLERSPAMLDLARAKGAKHRPEVAVRTQWVLGDMREFQLGQAFGLIYCTFRSFQHLLTPEDQRRCLACAAAHLRPGGRLVINLFDPRLDLCDPSFRGERSCSAPTIHPVTGNEVRVQTLSRENDAVNQVLTETWRFFESDAKGAVVRDEKSVLRMRWTYRFEMRHLLELAGLEVLAEHSDFHRSPPAYGKEQVWVARKPMESCC
ncbi:MAG: class I SAM-dependent methyltransferase [Planctomycetota bacterium]|nr:class I SAM-dependent methyltransferase [Planctomycetota bacterium]